MEHGNPTYHKTSVEVVRELQQQQQQHHSHAAASLAGHKRPRSESDAPQAVPPLPSDWRDPPALRSVSLAPPLPRLVASNITVAEPAAGHGRTEYSQRVALGATPGPSEDPELLLSNPLYDLPSQLTENLASLGIKSIYPWQKSCLLGPGLLSGEKNLVYSAPTGGGKSLVADLLMLKRVLEDRHAKAILVLPYVALVQEKVRWLRNIVQHLQRPRQDEDAFRDDKRIWRRRTDEDAVRVVAFFGGGRVRATWVDFDIGVCTIEKANALINTAIEDGSVAELRSIVLDELHFVDDSHRGYILELLTTKLLALEQPIQIVGMSATLPNIELLAQWLHGHSYRTFYRPVPIREHLVYDGSIYTVGSTGSLLETASQLRVSQASLYAAGTIQDSPHGDFRDPVLNAVVALTNETVQAGYGVLVFCGSRAGCESTARWISRVMPSFQEVDLAVAQRRIDLLGSLRALSSGIDPILEETVPCGVVFHHAGLTTEERELVADAYGAGAVKVCVATCSLAAGINLPARRVILYGARMGREIVGPALLRQMRGRAGRKGKDEVGETYLCCQRNDLDEVLSLIQQDMPQVSSCLLGPGKRRMERALLEVIAIRLATSDDTIDEYVGKTLLRRSSNAQSVATSVSSGLEQLGKLNLITRDGSGNHEATQLGKAIVASALEPDDGIFIHRELKRALEAFVMDGEMHAMYTFTPVRDFGTDINWQIYRSEVESLDESGQRVVRVLGIKPTVINKLAQGGTLKETTPEEKDMARVYRRFYVALQLRDLCNEMPVHLVARKYEVPRGMVQTLAHTCHGFAAGVVKFCEHMEWGVMAAALDHVSDRLRAGAKSDLLELSRITFIKSRTARVFWENGFRTVAAVANASTEEIVPILMQAQPNKIRLKGVEGEKYAEKLAAKAQVIVDGANRLWQAQMQQEVEEE